MAFYSQFRAAPNLLTLLRLFIIPFLVIEILDGNFGVAFSLFVLAGISDGFDGLLARWLSQQTKLGLYLDPIADKLLLSTLFLVLTHVGLMPRYVTVLVFSRDFGILLISTLLFATHTLRDFRPSLFGKPRGRFGGRDFRWSMRTWCGLSRCWHRSLRRSMRGS